MPIYRTLASFLLVLVVAIRSEAWPFYREIFRTCASGGMIVSTNAMDIAGWKAFTSRSTVGKTGFLKVNMPGSPDHMLAYNSSPRGPEEGSAFWSKPVSKPLTIFTDELAFEVSDLVLVQYQQRLDGYSTEARSNDGSRLALLIGDTWYISDQLARQVTKSVWEPVALSVRHLTYGTTPNRNGLGPDEPGNFNVPLPASGVVSAFGLFFSRVSGRVRIDNFTLSDSTIDLHPPGEQGTLEQCRELPAFSPENEAPEALFCDQASMAPAGEVRTSRAAQRRILRRIGGRSLEAVRDRAILSLLFRNRLRIDNLVNVPVSDYYTVGSLQLLGVSGLSKQTEVIEPATKKMVDRYLDGWGIGAASGMPLFQGLGSDGPDSTALCADRLKAIVLRRARAAGAVREVKFRR